jgi:hypothetical protein
MAFTYDTDSDIGRVRLITFDNQASSYIFEDVEIATFLALEGSSVKRAAALALETIASNEAMTLKVMRLLDLQTDGARTSDALLKRAGELRKQADREEAASDGGAFDVAEMVVDDFTFRRRLWNEGLRG